ncbi:MAG: L28 family ribosomal protein [Patescibacteria group bacterium]
MTRVCRICGRGPSIKITRSHSHIASKKWQNINLQSKVVDGKRTRVCTTCIKKIKGKTKK